MSDNLHTLTDHGTTNCPIEGVRAEVNDGECSACGMRVRETLLARDLTATLTDAGLPPSEHGGVRGAVLLLVGLWRGERQRADEAEARLRREKSLCAEANDAVQHYAQRASEAEARIARVEEAIAVWPDGNERASDYAAARGQCKRAIVATLTTEADR